VEHFNEYSWQGKEIRRRLEAVLAEIKWSCTIRYKRPPHAIAQCLLNEICEFKAHEESDDYSIEDLF